MDELDGRKRRTGPHFVHYSVDGREGELDLNLKVAARKIICI
jgi:hypothetical protein